MCKQFPLFPSEEYDRSNSTIITGSDLVQEAVDELLLPLSSDPQITGFEIALQVDTGNTIYKEFIDVEDALEFIQTYLQDSKKILDTITPKKRSQK